jgi:hypothetical protein
MGATCTTSTSAVAAGEGRTSGTSGQPSSNDHAVESRLPTDRLTLSATSSSNLSLVPSSIRVALVDLNWHRAMEEEFVTLIANNTWDLVPRLVGSNVVTDKYVLKHKFNFNGPLE